MAFWFATIANTEISQLNEEAVPNSTKKAKNFTFNGSFYRQIFVCLTCIFMNETVKNVFFFTNAN